MQLVIQDATGKAVASYSDFTLDHQYGDGLGNDKDDGNTFVLYVPNANFGKHYRILVDGTPFGGQITQRCPSSSPDEGDMVSYEGRTLQGMLSSRRIMPPANQSHLTVSGDANRVIEDVIERLDLDCFFEVPETPSGITVSSYRFNRFVDGWTGLRMMLSTAGARLRFTCHDGRHRVEAVRRTLYGDAPSEKVYFSLKVDDLPINHLIGLGKGQGTARTIVHWYADLFGNVSQTQTLFGALLNERTYSLGNEEDAEVSSKTKAKLEEYQTASQAELTLPPGVSLDVGDRVRFAYSPLGISAEAEVVQVVLKASPGKEEVSYKFGVPDYPKDEE